MDPKHVAQEAVLILVISFLGFALLGCLKWTREDARTGTLHSAS
jgi:hypothetical protein